MSSVVSLGDLGEKLRVASNPTQRRLYFAALLRDAAGIPTDEFLIVGGSAIEVYTVGEYTSGDIDVVSSRNDRLRDVLRSWKFTREGRVWVSEDLELVVDLNRYPYSGSFERTAVVTTPFGPVRIASIEDLLVKRLASAKHWRQREDFDHAKLLAAQYWERIDWGYVDEFARREDVSDFLDRLRDATLSNRAARRSTPP